MSTWGNRVQERKNGKQRQEYHIKTRQYAKVEPYPREDKNQIQVEKEKIVRLDKYDRIEKYDKYEKLQKRQEYSKSPFNKDYAQASFNESNKLTDVNINTQNGQKKENARNKGFEMRVSNIDNIHDKITNLLNLVKKDAKAIGSSNSKIKDSYGESTNQDLSPKTGWKDKIKRASTPTYGAKQNQIIGDQKYKVNKIEQGKRDHQRNRMTSALALQKPTQKGNFLQTRNKYLYSNEQDRNDEAVCGYGDLELKKYKPTLKYQQKPKQKEDRLKLNETSLLVSNRDRFNYSNNTNLSPRVENSQTEKRMERIINERKKEQQNQRFKAIEGRQDFEESNSVVSKQNKYYETEKQQLPIRNNKYQRISSKSKTAEQSIMPMTLLCNDANERAEAVTSTTRMIDEQIKRIKSKIQESETHNYRMQQRLNVDQNDTSGKRNTANSSDTTNKFQLKLHPVQIDKKETVKIAEILSSQVEIDNRMRDAREKFNSNKDESKWKELEHSLKTRGMKITIGQIKEMITLSSQEHNPFSDGQSSSLRSNNITDLFCAAQQHWENTVCGCSSLKLLKAEGFQASEMDLNKKGFLQVEDLVCFINLYTGHFYRNRDIMLIYRRLLLLEANKSKQGVQYSTLMRTLAL